MHNESCESSQVQGARAVLGSCWEFPARLRGSVVPCFTRGAALAAQQRSAPAFPRIDPKGGMRETRPASSQATLGCPRVGDRGQGASPGQLCPFLESLSSEIPLRSNPTVPPAPPRPPPIRVPIVTSTGLLNPRRDGDSSVPSFLPVREFSPDQPWHRRQSLSQGSLKQCPALSPRVTKAEPGQDPSSPDSLNRRAGPGLCRPGGLGWAGLSRSVPFRWFLSSDPASPHGQEEIAIIC